MKKRILSLLLAFLMAFSSVSTSVFAVDTVDENAVIGRTAKFKTQFPYLWSDPTNASSQIIVSAEALPQVVRIVSVHYFGTSTILYEIEAADGSAWPEAYKDYRYVDSTKLELLPQVNPTVSIVDKDGNPIGESGIFLPEGEKITVSAQLNTRAAATYQWQICYNNADGLWADLYGATNAQLPISGAMLRNVVDYYGKTFVRCVVTSNGQQITSDPIPVTMTAAPISYRLDTSRAESGAHYDEVSPADSTVKYAITVLFKYADTEQVWTSYLTQGQDYILDLECPDIPGYIPENGQTRVTRNITNIQENITIVVQYVPDFVDFVVEHYWQFVDKDDYELHETQTVSGLKTGEFVGANLHKTYTGFDHLNYDSEITVAADGSTVVKIYYDREYYMVSVNLNGGYGAEPICARYGTPIVVPDPQRKGYAFDGWLYDQTGAVHDDLPATVPAYNTSYTAQWTTANTKFTVAFWYENANDTEYTFAGSIREDGITGHTVNGSDYYNASFDGRDDLHFTYKNADSNVTIQADGSTVVNVYFSRNTYTLEYKEFVCPHTKGQHTADCCSLAVHTHTTACCTAQHIHNETPGECCSIHVHTYDCLKDGFGYWYTTASSDEAAKCNAAFQGKTLINGQTYSYKHKPFLVTYTYYFVWFDGTWYCKNVNTTALEWVDSCDRNALHDHNLGGCNTSKCGKTAHDHSSGRISSCNLSSCSNGGVAHTHGTNCNSSACSHTSAAYFKCACVDTVSIRTNPNNWVPAKDIYGNKASYTFKYEQSIGNTHANMGSYRWSPGVCDGYPYVPSSQDYGLSGAVGMVTSMPGGNAVFYRKSDGSYDYTVKYWLESYDGTGTKQGDKYFNHIETFYPSMGALDYDIDYINGIPTGFGVYQQWACDSNWNQKVQMGAGSSYGSEYLNYNFYYARKTFTLRYRNHETEEAVETVYYDKPLTKAEYDKRINTMISPYGSGYEFGGWYLDDACTVPVSWGSTRMPYGDMVLYAKWVPVTHKVTTYLTKGGQALASYDIYHENTVSTPVSDPVRAGFNFVGWFYEEDGVEKAYDFSMPVYKDMELYAKWTSDTFVTGNIYYKDTQGNILADFTPIRGTIGDTKTYNAKVGDALNLAPANVTYFPHYTSHSVTFSTQLSQNDYIFYYTAKEKVKYQVYFIDKDTGAEVAPTVTGESRSATLVFDLNEQNISVKKYTVDAMRKTFSLSADENLNKFYFYFT